MKITTFIVSNKKSALALLARAAKDMRRMGHFYPNQIDPAEEFVRAIINGNRSGLIIWPMQSGKTGIIACIMVFIRAVFGDVQGLFLVANEQVDLKRQNQGDLEPYGIDCLSRSDRRRWESKAGPKIVFYDENHFGDGKGMTIDQFFIKHRIKELEDVIFCGVSATPYSSYIGCLDFNVWPDVAAMEAAGYNSPKTMQHRIERSTRMVERIQGRGGRVSLHVVESCGALKHLDRAIKARRFGKYCIIRVRKDEADAVEAYIRRTYNAGEIFIKHWNMHSKGLVPESFFSRVNPMVFTIVLIQERARMGVQIDTASCEFMYEYRPQASLATSVQSLLGRMCGWHKAEHKATLYVARPEMATAYTMFINSHGDDARLTAWANYLYDEDISPSQRSEVTEKPGAIEMIRFPRDTKKSYHGNRSDEAIIAEIEAYYRAEGTVCSIRRTPRLSNETWVRGDRGRKGLHPSSSAGFRLGKDINDVVIVIFDDYHPNAQTKKDWKGTIAVAARRVSAARDFEVIPTDSTHEDFNDEGDEDDELVD